MSISDWLLSFFLPQVVHADRSRLPACCQQELEHIDNMIERSGVAAHTFKHADDILLLEGTAGIEGRITARKVVKEIGQTWVEQQRDGALADAMIPHHAGLREQTERAIPNILRNEVVATCELHKSTHDTEHGLAMFWEAMGRSYGRFLEARAGEP